MLGGDRRRLELAYSLMFTLPGTPVIRYGDEIGMGDDLALPERDLLPHADAMVDRAARRFHQEQQAGRARDQRRTVRLRACQRRGAAPRSEFAAELDRAHHPHAQGSSRGRLGRLQGAEHRRQPPCSPCATTGATTRCCFCTTSRTSRARSRSRPASREKKATISSTCSPPTTASRQRTASTVCASKAYGYRWYRVGGLDYLLKRSEF